MSYTMLITQASSTNIVEWNLRIKIVSVDNYKIFLPGKLCRKKCNNKYKIFDV